MFCTLEIFLIENQQSATDDRRGACLFVDSKTDGALIKVTGCNYTDERQNWAYTLKGQIMVSLDAKSSIMLVKKATEIYKLSSIVS